MHACTSYTHAFMAFVNEFAYTYAQTYCSDYNVFLEGGTFMPGCPISCINRNSLAGLLNSFKFEEKKIIFLYIPIEYIDIGEFEFEISNSALFIFHVLYIKKTI